jgi:hypothetical protein
MQQKKLRSRSRVKYNKKWLGNVSILLEVLSAKKI